MTSPRYSVEYAIKKGWIKAGEPLPKVAPAVTALAPAAARLAQIEREMRDSRQTSEGRKRPSDHEGEAQISVIEQFDLEFPVFSGRLFHVANGGKRTRYERHLMVKQGVRRGVPDLVLPVPRAPFHGLYVEMKAPKPYRSEVSDVQNDWITFLRGQGYCAEVARGGVEAMDIIRRYLHSEVPVSPTGA